jgi:hypothetical protein
MLVVGSAGDCRATDSLGSCRRIGDEAASADASWARSVGAAVASINCWLIFSSEGRD